MQRIDASRTSSFVEETLGPRRERYVFRKDTSAPLWMMTSAEADIKSASTSDRPHRGSERSPLCSTTFGLLAISASLLYYIGIASLVTFFI